MRKRKSTIIKDTVILLIITIISGFILGAVNKVTSEPILKARSQEKNGAYNIIFEDAEYFDENEELIETCKTSEEFLNSHGYDGVKIDEILIAKKRKDVIGYVINSTSSNGYNGDIQISLGIDKEGEIKGFEIITISETVGLGMKVNEQEFRSQFLGKKVEKIEYVKSDAKEENQIDAIGGATITTSAVVDAVNSALIYAKEYVLGEGGLINE